MLYQATHFVFDTAIYFVYTCVYILSISDKCSDMPIVYEHIVADAFRSKKSSSVLLCLMLHHICLILKHDSPSVTCAVSSLLWILYTYI